MNTKAKRIFYALSAGLSVILSLWIAGAGRSGAGSAVAYGLILMYVLTALALMAALLMAVQTLRHKPGTAKLTAAGAGILLLLTASGYWMDNHSVKAGYLKYGISSESASGLIGAVLIATWIVLGAAILLALFASVADFFKRM